jgi:hypothetical protein
MSDKSGRNMTLEDFLERERQWAATKARGEENRAFMLAQLRPAQPWEYGAWLKGYLLAGGRPTHIYDHRMTEMYVALTDLSIRPLYGADSLNIILPEGIREDGGDTGHVNLFIVNKYLQRGFHQRTPTTPEFVPVYSDTVIP